MKKRIAAIAVFAVALLSSVYVMQAQAAEKKVVIEIKKIAQAVSDGKDMKTILSMGEKLAKGAAEDDVYLVMEVFAKRKANGKGGVGIGAEQGKITPDGIEAMLMEMRRGLKLMHWENVAELKKMTDILAAGAAAAYHVAPDKIKKNRVVHPLWQTYCQQMITRANKLAVALKKKDKDAVKVAAGKLESCCITCHKSMLLPAGAWPKRAP